MRFAEGIVRGSIRTCSKVLPFNDVGLGMSLKNLQSCECCAFAAAGSKLRQHLGSTSPHLTMAKRSANLLVAAVVACALYVLLPGESFVAPQSLRGSAPQAEAGAFAQAPSFQTEGRSVQVSMAATGGEPTRFPLVFLGLLAGTAAVGLLAVFFYGSYSGAGSGL